MVRALPLWSKNQPGYGILYSFYGFGLEELGDYTRAEDVSREAAELEPHGYWPHHAVSHVLEMMGRPGDGLKWMAEREPYWAAKANGNQVHIHWHKALFHVELGEPEAALALLDGPIRTTLRPVGTSLCNATALLWRLEMLGLDPGERWQDYVKLWNGRTNGATSVFNDIHGALTLLKAGDDDGFARLRAQMQETAAAGMEQSPTWRRRIACLRARRLCGGGRALAARALQHGLHGRQPRAARRCGLDAHGGGRAGRST